MLLEVQIACQFLTSFILSEISESQTKLFSLILSTLLHAKYNNHWDLKNPNKGNAFRAVTIFNGALDSIILSAAQAAGIVNIGKYLPNELCLWIDPYNVSYKIGDHGNIITLYESPESKTYSPTMMTKNVSNSSSKSSKSIHNKHRNSMNDGGYMNKNHSQNGRSKKYNGNNNSFTMKKNLSNKENNNSNYPKYNQSNSGNGRKNESQYQNTNSRSNEVIYKKERKVKSPKINYQTKPSPKRELSPIAKSLRAQLVAQSRFSIPFLFPNESEVVSANANSSFMDNSDYVKPITFTPQIMAN